MRQIKNHGFTLIEILIAIAILSFMAIGVFQIVSQSSDTAEKVTIEDQEFVQVVGALKKVERDFTSIYSPLYFSPPMGMTENQEQDNDNYYKDPEKLPVNQKYKEHNLFDGTTEDGHPIPAIFYERNAELIIFTSAHKRKYEDEKESTFSWVRYFITSNPDNPEQQILYRQEIAENIFNTDLDWGASPAFPLLNNILKFEIFFWDQKQKDWSDTISEESKYLGKAMKVQLIWQDRNGNENTEMRTYRILWPDFDPIADLKKKLSAKYGRSNATSRSNSNNFNQGFEEVDREDL